MQYGNKLKQIISINLAGVCSIRKTEQSFHVDHTKLACLVDDYDCVFW